MKDHNKQALDFLAETNTTLEVKEATPQRMPTHWGEQHELFDQAHEENTKRHPELYDTYTCELCGSHFLHSRNMYTCNECLDNLPL